MSPNCHAARAECRVAISAVRSYTHQSHTEGSHVSLLPETGRRVDEIAARAQAEGHTPSLALAVVRDRAVLHFAGVGGHLVPDTKTQYRLGSITKTMTATMI